MKHDTYSFCEVQILLYQLIPGNNSHKTDINTNNSRIHAARFELAIICVCWTNVKAIKFIVLLVFNALRWNHTDRIHLCTYNVWYEIIVAIVSFPFAISNGWMYCMHERVYVYLCVQARAFKLVLFLDKSIRIPARLPNDFLCYVGRL